MIENGGQRSGLSQARVRCSWLGSGVRGAQGKTRLLRMQTYDLTHDDGWEKYRRL